MHYIILSMAFLTSCGSLPQLYQAAEDIANDEAIEIMVSRGAISKQTDINISIDVKNKPAAVAK